MKRTAGTQIWILVSVVIFSILSIAFTVGADEKSGKGKQDKLTQVRSLKIVDKSEGFIRTSDIGFRVKENTAIVDQMGLQISLADLPVPCKAEIYFRPIKTALPKAKKIIVTEIYPESTTDWNQSE